MTEGSSKKTSSKKSTSKSSKGRSMDIKSIGKYAFLLGIVIAVIIGLVPAESMSEWVIWLMILLALVGGWVHISREDETHFIILTIGLALFSRSLNQLPPSVGEGLTSVFDQLATFLGVAIIALVVRNILGWFRR